MSDSGAGQVPTRKQEPIADSSPVLTRYPDMAGKVAAVTGAARGMGAAILENLLAQGVHVIGADIDVTAMQALAERVRAQGPAAGGRVRASHMDVTNSPDHETVADLAVSEFGRLDFWVNNVGVFPESAALEISAEQMATTMKLNVNSVLFGAQAAARRMPHGGAIVNISSTAASRARPGRAAYGTSKAAVSRLTRSLALEFADLGIRVNSVAPGFVDTTMTHWIQNDPPRLRRVLDAIPLHRFASSEEVAAAVLFLLSGGARYVTGAEIVVDGGASA